MKILIRNEEEKDYRKVEEVARESFWNLYFPGCNEHLSIHKLRKSEDFIKELTFVIEVDEEIIGSIFYSHSKIIMENDEELKTITFGPVNIHPKYHRMGLGKKLITHSIEKAKELNYGAILTLGYPYHYAPYGFVGGKKYNIAMEDNNYYIGLLALELKKDYLSNIKGYASFTPSLDCSEEETNEFDKSFEIKEKKVQDSQKEFEITCSTIDTKTY